MRQRTKRTQKPRGFTLVELMVSSVMSALVLAGGVSSLIAFTRLENNLSNERGAGQQNRRAIAIIERLVASAGYGIDPSITFDPHRPDVDCGGVCPTNNVKDSDSAGGVESDDLLFASRDPAYFALTAPDPTGVNPTVAGHAWLIKSATLSSVTLEFNGSKTTLYQGSVLLAVCPGGFTYTLATVDTMQVISDTADTTVTLRNPSVADDPFQRPDALSAACFASGRGRAFLINRYRLMVRLDPDSGRRFLVLSRSLDLNLDGNIDAGDWEILAADVGDLQVAYVMRDGTVWGGDPGAPLIDRRPKSSTLAAVGQPFCSDELTVPFYKERALAPCAVGSSPQRPGADVVNDTGSTANELWGNTKALRISLVTQTRRALRSGSGAGTLVTDAPVMFSTEDHVVTTGPDGRRRFKLSSIVRLPNMQARGVPLI